MSSKETTSSSSSTTSTSTSTVLRVVVVGGGPVGTATALAIAKRHGSNNNNNNNNTINVQVELYEAYPHPMEIETNSPKAYVISLAERGYKSLEQMTGIDFIENVHLMQGDGAVVTHNLAREPNPKHKVMKRNPPNLIVPRKVLSGTLMNMLAQQEHDKDKGDNNNNSVNVYLQHELQDIDLETQTLTIYDQQTKTKKTVQYDLLIGADGCNSKVRTILNEKITNKEEFHVERLEEDSMEYQVTTLPSNLELFPHTPKDTVHAWNNKKYNSICLAFPIYQKQTQNENNEEKVVEKLLAPIVFPQGKLEEFRNNHLNQNQDKDASSSSGPTYKDAIQEVMPNLPDSARDEMIRQLAIGEPANGGTCVWVSSLVAADHSVALVGDAAHGQWPSLGQGCNASLETAAIFCQTFTDHFQKLGNNNDNNSNNSNNKKEWISAMLKDYNQRRYDDARACVDLTYGGIGARLSRGRQNAPVSFKLQVLGMMVLNKLSMGIIPKPALFRIMEGDPNFKYSTARSFHFYYEKAICCTALLTTLSLAFTYYHARRRA